MGRLYQGFLMRFSNYCLIQNNYVHDISVPSDHDHNGGCFMVNGLAGTNTNYNIFEYNTADGGTTLCYNAFGGKGGNYNDCTWRYNLAINCIGPLVMAMGSTDGATGVYRGKVHNNVAVNCGALFEDYRHGHDFEVYNNSFYGKTSSYVFNLQWEMGAQMPSGLIFYNNLIQRGARNYQRDCSSCGNWPGYFSYIDYNQVYSVTYWAGGPGGLTSTLAEWKALVSSLVSGSENGDYNSSTTSPGFVNAGGSTAADYKRSSYPTDGRGGAYPSVKGAYITGSETIGYSEGGTPTSTPTITGVMTGSIR